MTIPAGVSAEMAVFDAADVDGTMVARVAYTLERLGYTPEGVPEAAAAIFAGSVILSGVADDALRLGVLRAHEAGAVRQVAAELAGVCVALAGRVPA